MYSFMYHPCTLLYPFMYHPCTPPVFLYVFLYVSLYVSLMHSFPDLQNPVFAAYYGMNGCMWMTCKHPGRLKTLTATKLEYGFRGDCCISAGHPFHPGSLLLSACTKQTDGHTVPERYARQPLQRLQTAACKPYRWGHVLIQAYLCMPEPALHRLHIS